MEKDGRGKKNAGTLEFLKAEKKKKVGEGGRDWGWRGSFIEKRRMTAVSIVLVSASAIHNTLSHFIIKRCTGTWLRMSHH